MARTPPSVHAPPPAAPAPPLPPPPPPPRPPPTPPPPRRRISPSPLTAYPPLVFPLFRPPCFSSLPSSSLFPSFLLFFSPPPSFFPVSFSPPSSPFPFFSSFPPPLLIFSPSLCSSPLFPFSSPFCFRSSPPLLSLFSVPPPLRLLPCFPPLGLPSPFPPSLLWCPFSSSSPVHPPPCSPFLPLLSPLICLFSLPSLSFSRFLPPYLPPHFPLSPPPPRRDFQIT